VEKTISKDEEMLFNYRDLHAKAPPSKAKSGRLRVRKPRTLTRDTNFRTPIESISREVADEEASSSRHQELSEQPTRTRAPYRTLEYYHRKEWRNRKRKLRDRNKDKFKCSICEVKGEYLFTPDTEARDPRYYPTLRCSNHMVKGQDYRNISRIDYEQWGTTRKTETFIELDEKKKKRILQ